MVNSPRLRFFNNFRNKPTKKEIVPDAGTVQGWLLNVHTYRDESMRPSETHYLVDGDNNCIPIETNPKEGRAKSIISIDSVNLEELINNNFTTDMDDETDLPELANLDLDDSKDDFWTLEKGDSLQSFDHSFHDYLKSPELDWSPNELSGPCRSDSFSSENSLTSHSSIYAKYGMVPLSYPSESSSTSSRSHSRLSSYSASSHQTVIPTTSKSRERPTSLRKPTTIKVVTAIPTTKTKTVSKQKSTIANRASHIPFSKKAAPTPQKSTSTSSSTTTSTATTNTTASSPKVAMSRILSSSSSSASSAASNNNYNNNNYNSSASSSTTTTTTIATTATTTTTSRHIQSSRPGSPLSLGYTQSRIAIPKSPTGDRRTTYKRVMSPIGHKPSGILPPGSMGHLGTVKRL